jgi:hypothetical protein
MERLGWQAIGNSKRRGPQNMGPARPRPSSNQSTRTWRAEPSSTVRIRARTDGPLFRSTRERQLRARLCIPWASQRRAPIKATIAAAKSRMPCHSVMVNRGLKLMHKLSYVALRSARRRLGAAAQSTSNSARLESQSEFAPETYEY